MHTPPDLTTRLDVPVNYNLRRTMSGHRMGAFDPSLRVDDAVVRLALRTPDGPPAALEIDKHEKSMLVRGLGAGTDWLNAGRGPHAQRHPVTKSWPRLCPTALGACVRAASPVVGSTNDMKDARYERNIHSAGHILEWPTPWSG